MNPRRTFYPKKQMILMCDFDRLGVAVAHATGVTALTGMCN